jgi:hypothetical protein
MAALPSTFASFKPLSPARPVESGKPPASVTHPSINPLPPAPNRRPALRTASLFTLPKEPEDARITGGTRSLDRRLLALNLAGSRITTVEN